jgi:hypothetical protein
MTGVTFPDSMSLLKLPADVVAEKYDSEFVGPPL